MRWIGPLLAAACLTPFTAAQHTLDWPVEELVPFFADSGVQANLAPTPEAVFMDVVAVRDAGWLRLYFHDVELADGSFVRITSLLDGEVQELDSSGMALWGNASAYFNGDTLLVELIAGPRTERNRISIEQVARQNPRMQVGGDGQCGICDGDDRVPSSELWSSRLLPAGCTASVYDSSSCMVSAGHCVSGGMVVQFNVPPSNGNCSINNPPVVEQFPITSFSSVNGGVGNDWSVLVPGTNNLGELPFQRYGELRPIAAAPPANGQSVAMWGYGVDQTCVNSQTQQTSGGSITFVNGSWIEYNVDVRGGNSGSALIRNDEIIGIVTHCSFGCPNFATRVNNAAFANARADCGGDVSEVAPLSGFSVRRGDLLSGNLASLVDSDNSYVQIDAVPNGNGNQQMTLTQIDAISPFASVAQLDVTVEVAVDVAAASSRTRVQIRNWTTNTWTTLDNYSQGTSDLVRTFLNIPNPDDHIRDNNDRIRVRILTKIRTNQAPNGYVARIDHVEVVVTP